jgi:hypothetical protein
MSRVNRISMRAAAPFAACCLLALIGVAHAGDKPRLSGSWNFNTDQSDDAQQKVQQAKQSSQTRSGGSYPGGGGGYPGGSYPAGGGGYPGAGGYPGGGGVGRGGMGGMGPDGIGNPGAAVSNQASEQLAANPKYLNITQHDDQILITDSEHTTTLYPDGKKHKATDESGNKISTKSEWQGDELITERKMGTGRLTDTYRVSSDGKQLIVISRYEDLALSQPLSIRRVYDLGDQTR